MAQVLRLDPIRCDGYGICAVHLPDRITLDEWGYPVIEPGPVPERLLSRARRATGHEGVPGPGPRGEDPRMKAPT